MHQQIDRDWEHFIKLIDSSNHYLFVVCKRKEKSMKNNWFNKTVQETEKNLETNIQTGLTQEQQNKNLANYGLNELQAQKKKSLFIKFLEQFKDFMIIVLIFAAIISGAI